MEYELKKVIKLLDDTELEKKECQRDLDAYKERISLLESSHQQSLDEMKNHYEYMKKSQFERELKEQNMKHQSEKMNYEA